LEGVARIKSARFGSIKPWLLLVGLDRSLESKQQPKQASSQDQDTAHSFHLNAARRHSRLKTPPRSRLLRLLGFDRELQRRKPQRQQQEARERLWMGAWRLGDLGSRDGGRGYYTTLTGWRG
jgi:hypothetical protein